MIRNSADLLLEGDRSREPSGELGEDFSGSGKCKGPGVAWRWPWGGPEVALGRVCCVRDGKESTGDEWKERRGGCRR